MAEGGAGEAAMGVGEQQEAPVEHGGEELEEAGAPAMNVGEQQEAPRTGQVAEAAAAEGAGEEPPAAGHAGEEPKAAEAPAMDVGEQQEAPGMGQVAEAPAAEDAGEEPEARGARLFIVVEKQYFDVMVSGEKTVEYREKKALGADVDR